MTLDISAKTVNYLRDTALVDNQLVLTFKYNIKKVHVFSLKRNNIKKYIYDIKDGALPASQNISQYKHKSVRAFRIGQHNKRTLRVVIESLIVKKPSYSIKGKVLTIYLPLLKASKHKKVKTSKKSTLSKNRLIIIDAGHGGRDCGAFSRGRKEKHITLAIAHKLRKKLQSKGYKVLMTRKTDKYLSLKQRTEFANRNNGSIFISIHSNASPRKKSRHTIYKGVEVFYLSLRNSKRIKNKRAFYKGKRIYSRRTYQQMTSRLKIKQSRRLSKNLKKGLLKSVRKRYRVIDKGIKRADFWVLLGTKMPSILIETGYITDKQEGRRLANNHYQNLLVAGIAKGVDRYFGKK
jgi:N-acetylmuramoyl-L-alanine amidase